MMDEKFARALEEAVRPLGLKVKFLACEGIYDQVMRAVTLDRPFCEVYLEEEKIHAAV